MIKCQWVKDKLQIRKIIAFTTTENYDTHLNQALSQPYKIIILYLNKRFCIFEWRLCHPTAYI